MATAKRKIIWALDPFEEPKMIQKAAEFLKLLNKNHAAVIEPVYILMPYHIDSLSSVAEISFDKYKVAANKAFTAVLKKTKVPGVSKPKVVASNSTSIHEGVKELYAYAKIKDADQIVINSHARKGLQSLFLGSFAETLVLHSDIPTVVLNPFTRLPQDLKRIMFPTDFTEESFVAFEKLVDYAAKRKCDIVLFHQQTEVMHPLINSGAFMFAGSYYPDKDYFNQERQRLEDAAAEWKAFAAKKKVKVVAKINDVEKGKEDVSDCINEYAKRLKCQMIAMASVSSGFTATVIGSVTQNVVRSTKLPIWILHPKHKSKKKKGSKGVKKKKSADGVIDDKQSMTLSRTVF